MDPMVLQKAGEALGPALKKLDKQAGGRKFKALSETVAALVNGLPQSLCKGELVEGICRHLAECLESKQAKVVDAALDVCSKLVGSGMIRGEVYKILAPNLQGDEKEKKKAKKKKKKKGEPDEDAELGLDAILLGRACSCYDMGDENVEMSLTKFLVTATMSPLLVIHGEALLTVVRALYNIHLGSRSEVNQCMAKAALFQIMDTVLQRMERDTSVVPLKAVHVVDIMGGPAMVAQQGKKVISTVQKTQEAVGSCITDLAPIIMMMGGAAAVTESVTPQGAPVADDDMPLPPPGSPPRAASPDPAGPPSPPPSPTGPAPKTPPPPAKSDPFGGHDAFGTPQFDPAKDDGFGDDPFGSFGGAPASTQAAAAGGFGGGFDDFGDSFGASGNGSVATAAKPAAAAAADPFGSFGGVEAEDDPFGSFGGAPAAAAAPKSPLAGGSAAPHADPFGGGFDDGFGAAPAPAPAPVASPKVAPKSAAVAPAKSPAAGPKSPPSGPLSPPAGPKSPPQAPVKPAEPAAAKSAPAPVAAKAPAAVPAPAPVAPAPAPAPQEEEDPFGSFGAVPEEDPFGSFGGEPPVAATVADPPAFSQAYEPSPSPEPQPEPEPEAAAEEEENPFGDFGAGEQQPEEAEEEEDPFGSFGAQAPHAPAEAAVAFSQAYEPSPSPEPQPEPAAAEQEEENPFGDFGAAQEEEEEEEAPAPQAPQQFYEEPEPEQPAEEEANAFEDFGAQEEEADPFGGFGGSAQAEPVPVREPTPEAAEEEENPFGDFGAGAAQEEESDPYAGFGQAEPEPEPEVEPIPEPEPFPEPTPEPAANPYGSFVAPEPRLSASPTPGTAPRAPVPAQAARALEAAHRQPSESVAQSEPSQDEFRSESIAIESSAIHEPTFEPAVAVPPPGPSANALLAAEIHAALQRDLTDQAVEEGEAPMTAAQEERQEKAEDQLSEYGTDAYVVFRAFVKLSLKAVDVLKEGTKKQQIDPISARGKCLALELIRGLLERSGPTLRRSEAFVVAIRQQLCLSLLKNLSTFPEAMRLSCSIFLSLLVRFRQHLKAEIGIFYPMFILKCLEAAAGIADSPDIQGIPLSFNNLALVLRVTKGLCEHGQLLLDVFVNYDCDLQGSNLYERTVKALVKLAVGGKGAFASGDPNSGVLTPPQVAYVRVEALACIVRLMNAHWEWVQSKMPHKEGSVAAAPAALGGGGSPAPRPSVGGSATPGPAAGRASVEGGALSGPDASEASGTAGDGALKRGAKGSSVNVTDLRAAKEKFAEGVTLFNKKPVKGVAFMHSNGLVGESDAETARFLFDTKGLDKMSIGEYLGEGEPFPIHVMHAYIDLFDFTGIEFDDAIRRLLASFRLPGEAQKIDRIIEKFSERYFRCNPSAFRSASAAYTLGFSVIMLNTDAHNPTVKNKMTKQDFIRNNRGMNDGMDFPADYLTALYDRIVTNEIKMRDDDMTASAMGASAASIFAPANLFLETMLGLLGRKGQTQEDMEARVTKVTNSLREMAQGTTFHEVSDAEALRPVLEAGWIPLTECLIALFEEHENPKICELCCKGLKAAACLVCALGMERQRRFITHVLARYSLIHMPPNMRHKSVYAIRALLGIAETQGNNLQESWVETLRFVSRLDAIYAVGVQGAPIDSVLFGGRPQVEEKKGLFGKKIVMSAPLPPPRKADAGDPYRAIGAIEFLRSGKLLQLPTVSELAALPPGTAPEVALPGPGLNNMELVLNPKEVEGIALQVLKAIDAGAPSRLFARTQNLDSDAIVEFVKGLCAVAMEELSSQSTLRVYSMAKIVEVSLYNTHRIRLVWSKIWAVLGDFFCRVGCHPNLQVAMYAVDSLRQLSSRSLEREELNNFSFQNDFMRPFVAIMKHSQSVEIREMIIRSVSQMVLAKVANVKSGWKTVLQLFTVAAHDPSNQLMTLSFETIEKIVREHFVHIVETEAVTFTDLVQCLIAYTGPQSTADVALNAIAFLRYCAIMLAEGHLGKAVDELPPDRADSGAEGGVDNTPVVNKATEVEVRGGSKLGPGDGAGGIATFFTDKGAHMYFWIPLLAGLSELSYDSRLDIRRAALGVLFDILKFHGPAFSASFWVKVFDSVLFTIFDEVKAGVAPPNAGGDLSEPPTGDGDDAADGAAAASITGPQDGKPAAPVVPHHNPMADQWLYETCSICLGSFVEIFGQFFPRVSSQLPRFLELMGSFMQRAHDPLAGLCLDSAVRLISSAGKMFQEHDWADSLVLFTGATEDLWPDMRRLAYTARDKAALGQKILRMMGLGAKDAPPPSPKPPTPQPQAAAPAPPPKKGGLFGRQKSTAVDAPPAGSPPPQPPAPAEGAAPGPEGDLGRPSATPSTAQEDTSGALGATAEESVVMNQAAAYDPMPNDEWGRMLARCRGRHMLLVRLVSGMLEVYTRLTEHVSPASFNTMLSVLETLRAKARDANSDDGLRRALQANYHDRRPDKREVMGDPPLLKLEIEATSAHVSLLVFATARKDELATVLREKCQVEKKLVECTASYLERFDALYRPKPSQPATGPGPQPQASEEESSHGSAASSVAAGARAGMAKVGALFKGGLGRGDHGQSSGSVSSSSAAVSASVPPLFSQDEARAHAAMVVAVLNAIGFFEPEVFRRHMDMYYPRLVRLVGCPGADWEARKALAQLLETHVGPFVLSPEALKAMLTASGAIRAAPPPGPTGVLALESGQSGPGPAATAADGAAAASTAGPAQ